MYGLIYVLIYILIYVLIYGLINDSHFNILLHIHVSPRPRVLVLFD